MVGLRGSDIYIKLFERHFRVNLKNHFREVSQFDLPLLIGPGEVRLSCARSARSDTSGNHRKFSLLPACAGIFPDRPHKVVLGISLLPNAFKDTTPEGVSFRTTSWQHLSALPSHPLVDELTRYVGWKMINSKMMRKSGQ